MLDPVGAATTSVRRGVNDAVLPERLQARRPVRRGPASVRRGAAGRPPWGRRRPDHRLRSGRSRAGRADGQLPRHQDGRHRPQGRPARGRPSRRRRLPHGGAVRGVRPGGSPGERGLLGQRGRLLAAGPARPDQDHAHRAYPGRRRGLVGDAPRDRQPGAHARLPPGPHGAVGQQAAAVLRPPRRRHPDRHRRLVGVPGDGHLAAPQGPRGDRRNLDDPGEVCRRLRRLAQRHPGGDRPRTARATR